VIDLDAEIRKYEEEQVKELEDKENAKENKVPLSATP
jgi:hypothetical protein